MLLKQLPVLRLPASHHSLPQGGNQILLSWFNSRQQQRLLLVPCMPSSSHRHSIKQLHSSLLHLQLQPQSKLLLQTHLPCPKQLLHAKAPHLPSTSLLKEVRHRQACIKSLTSNLCRTMAGLLNNNLPSLLTAVPGTTSRASHCYRQGFL